MDKEDGGVGSIEARERSRRAKDELMSWWLAEREWWRWMMTKKRRADGTFARSGSEEKRLPARRALPRPAQHAGKQPR